MQIYANFLSEIKRGHFYYCSTYYLNHHTQFKNVSLLSYLFPPHFFLTGHTCITARLQTSKFGQAITILSQALSSHPNVFIMIFLEAVKEQVAKSWPYFLQILHISPKLDKITQPFYIFQQKLT